MARRRQRKPTKPAADYSVAEVADTATYENLLETLPSLCESEAVRLTRVELDALWTAQNAGKVNRLCLAFMSKLAALGVTGKTVKLVKVSDRFGNVYFNVSNQAGGMKHPQDETLPKGHLGRPKVLALRD